MVDLHCHILHDIDDGPKDIDTSIRLCEMARENGIEKLIATPHLSNLIEFEDFITLRDLRINELRKEIERRKIKLEIYGGSEVYVTDDIFQSASLKNATLNSSRYLLVEFEFFRLSFTKVTEYIDAIFKMDLVPVIAHPERYDFFQADYEGVNYLLDKGVLFQLNAGSLAGFGNKEEFNLAYEMAYKNAASFIATDAHSLRNRPNDLLKMLRYFPSNISQKGLEHMLNMAPEAVLKNEPIPTLERGILKKRRRF